MDRREMLKRCLGLGAAAALGGGALWALLGRQGKAEADLPRGWHEVAFYDKLSKSRVQCKICPKECVVGDGERGYCGSKENRGGRYYTLVYGQVAAVNVDPIEKKPFFHVLPGSTAFSIGTAGCNFDCRTCQNWEISQRRPEQVKAIYLPPDTVAAKAKQYQCRSIAYTYTEPSTFYTYMRDTAKAGQAAGVRSVMVSNGYLNREPMVEVAKYLDAIKVDFKAYSDDYYQRYCDGTLAPVLETIKRVKALGKWLEVVWLVVPGLTDSPDKLKAGCEWLVKAVGPDVPLHFSRFYPQYRLKNLPATPYETLERCHGIAKKAGLHYVYVGNVEQAEHQQTYCPACRKVVIRRSGYEIGLVALRSGKCKYCGHAIPGVWE